MLKTGDQAIIITTCSHMHYQDTKAMLTQGDQAVAVPWAYKSLGQPPSRGLQGGCPSSAASAALPLSHLA